MSVILTWVINARAADHHLPRAVDPHQELRHGADHRGRARPDQHGDPSGADPADAPVTIVTLGVFILVVNALCFWFASSLLKGFEVSGFWSAFFGSILYSIVSWLLSALIFGQRDIG